MSGPRITGTLKNASIQPVPFATDDTFIAHGLIYGDVHGRWPDGTRIRTSKIVYGPDEDGIIHTRNSVYKLETSL